MAKRTRGKQKSDRKCGQMRDNMKPEVMLRFSFAGSAFLL